MGQYRNRDWKYQTNKRQPVEQDNKGSTDPRFKYPGLNGRKRWLRFVQDNLKRQAMLLWCQDLLTDEEHENIKDMIESEDEANLKTARAVIWGIGERNNMNFKEE